MADHSEELKSHKPIHLSKESCGHFIWRQMSLSMQGRGIYIQMEFLKLHFLGQKLHILKGLMSPRNYFDITLATVMMRRWDRKERESRSLGSQKRVAPSCALCVCSPTTSIRPCFPAGSHPQVCSLSSQVLCLLPWARTQGMETHKPKKAHVYLVKNFCYHSLSWLSYLTWFSHL